MSEIIVNGITGLVNDIHVYDLDESIKASKYPMLVDVSHATPDITNTTLFLGTSEKGEGHDNFLNGIRVAFNLTFSNKAWVEAERYHFFDFTSSQSTMHCATRFNIDNQCNEYVDDRIISIANEKVVEYNRLSEYLKVCPEEERAKVSRQVTEAYLEVVYNLPAGFKLTARMTTNYRQLKTVYDQRKNHRLPEWRAFCEWMKEYLPEFNKIVLGDGMK